MKYFLILISLIFASVAEAQTSRNPCYNTTGQTGLPNCIGVGTAAPLPVISQPPGGGITGNAAGSTAAVVGTLDAATGKTTFICGFNVQSIGGTATVAGLIGSSQVYQTDVNSATVGKTVAAANFNPCIPARATKTAITITTTANGTATAVDVNSWGYQQ